MILVTGGAGLVGSELIRQLLAGGYPVRALYNKTPLPDFKSDKLQQIQCDIMDVVALEQYMQGVTEVYHCAAIVSFDASKKKPMYRINIEGTANVVNTALVTGIKKLVHVSSVAALGRITENGPVNETMNWTEETSKSHYGKSKYLGELEVWRGIGEGLDAVIVNPVIILGGGDWNTGSTQIFKTAHDEFPWYTSGSGGFVDVRDVAACMIALMKSNISSERFIISAENKTYREIFTAIARAFGKKPPHKNVTPFIAQVVWRLEAIKSLFTAKKPLLTKETAHTAMIRVEFDNRKLLRFLPAFCYRDIEETIQHTCAQMQHKLNKG